MSVFVHAYGIKTVHEGGGGQKLANSVHVVVECPIILVAYVIKGTELQSLGLWGPVSLFFLVKNCGSFSLNSAAKNRAGNIVSVTLLV